jgi:hypothetical protein
VDVLADNVGASKQGRKKKRKEKERERREARKPEKLASPV